MYSLWLIDFFLEFISCKGDMYEMVSDNKNLIKIAKLGEMSNNRGLIKWQSGT